MDPTIPVKANGHRLCCGHSDRMKVIIFLDKSIFRVVLRFTKKERRSLLVFAWAILALLVIRYWLSSREVPLTLYATESPVAGIEDQTVTPRHRQNHSSSSRSGQLEKKQSRGLADYATGTPERALAERLPEVFDPNHASFEVMVAAGLPRRVAHTILNYREKGGKFYKKEDLLKIYVMTDSIYTLVEPWVNIPPMAATRVRDRPRELIDINAADPEEWTYLPGIGKGYAGRICRYREALHGFVSIEQVRETFGLPDTVFQRIQSMITLNTAAEGIDVNSWTAEELASHPYIRSKEARILTNYRMQHGPYHHLDDIQASMAIPDADRFQQLVPYWRFGEGLKE